MPIKVTHAPSEETLGRLADATERQNNLLAAIANGTASAAFIDATYAAMLDDTNTTEIFRLWWPLSDDGTSTKEQRITRWFNIMRNDKTYGCEFNAPEVSGDTMGTRTDAAAGESCDLATDTTQGVDTLDEHRAFWWLRVNAVECDAQGTLDIKFMEFEEGYDPTGDVAPVFTLQVAPYIKKTRTNTKLSRQLRTRPAVGYHAWAEGRNPDGSQRAYVAHAATFAGLNAAGNVTAGAGRRPLIRTSYSTGLSKIKQGNQYQTGWQTHDQNWLLLMWQLRHASLAPSGQMEGCLSYNFQYLAAAGEQNTRRVLLTTANAANLIVGSSVCVGETGGNTNADRNQAVNYNLADCVQIASKETVTVNGVEYVAVNLDIPNTINTTATTRISTMPWYSGSTDAVLGRADGSPRSNTNGQNACRCAGIEFGIGCYMIAYGDLYNYTTAADGVISELQVWSCKEQGKEAASVTADYVDTGLRLYAASANWYYDKEMDDTYDGVLIPKTIGGTGASSSAYLRDAFYHPAYKAGVYVPWLFAGLDGGGTGGLVCVHGNVSAGSADWHGALGLSRRCWRGELPEA